MSTEPDPAGRALRVTHRVRIPQAELTWRFSTSGGPGGQHVNTSHTRAELSWDVAASPSLDESSRARLTARLGPTVTVAASDRRSQARNRALAEERLVERVRQALHVDPPRRATRPTLASKRRRLEAKRRTGERKRDRRGGWDTE